MALLGFPELYETASSDDGLQDYQGQLMQKDESVNVSDWNIRSSQTGKTLAGVVIQHVTEIPFEVKEKTDEEKGPVRFIILTSPKKSRVNAEHNWSRREIRSLEPNGGDLELCCWGLKGEETKKNGRQMELQVTGSCCRLSQVHQRRVG